MRKYQVGDIYKWRGIRNSDTGEIDSGYLYIVTAVTENGSVAGTIGESIYAKNRSEAIKKYKANPDNPNNRNYVA